MESDEVTFENLDRKARENIEFAAVVKEFHLNDEQWAMVSLGISAGIAVTLKAVNEAERL